MKTCNLYGAGLGLRQEMMDDMRQDMPQGIGFLEVAPENWMRVGGVLGEKFRWFTDNHPFVCHGLSMSLGGPNPLDEIFIKEVGAFLRKHSINFFSEHLSFCTDNAHLYDLMPIPFTEEAVKHVAQRISRAQDLLGQQIAVENVSYYAAPGQKIKEIDFINAVLDEADCLMLLDVNNIYVNSINHKYDAHEFLHGINGNRIAYIHVAGHYQEADDLIVDTHGADVIDPVWALLEEAYKLYGVHPTLLERDFNIPSLDSLIQEVNIINTLQAQYGLQNEQQSGLSSTSV